MLDRPLTPGERKYSLIERLLSVVVWGVKKLSRYTLWALEIIMVLPDAAEIVYVESTLLNTRLLDC